MSVLEIVTNVLEKMDSDEVNSIFDTVESRGVAQEVEDSFRIITANSEDYHTEGYIQLESVSDTDHFNQLKLPTEVMNLHEFWYKDHCGERVVPEYLEPREFVDMLFRCAKGQPTCEVAAIGTTGPCFPVGIEEDPEYYTSFDKTHIFLDKVDLRTKESLPASSTGARATVAPVFKLEDNFIPPLRADEFPFLLNEVIDACFINYKGVSNSKAQKRARDQKVMKQNNRKRFTAETRSANGPPYGRRSRTGSVSNPYGNGT